MKKEDYYALVNYRGREKHYYISNSMEDGDGYDTRLEYIDYKPNREHSGVWIKNGKERIKTVFDSTTEEYRYFKSLDNKFFELVEEWSDKLKKWYSLDHTPFIGRLNVLTCFKKALKETPNPLGIKI